MEAYFLFEVRQIISEVSLTAFGWRREQNTTALLNKFFFTKLFFC